jgi:hypothetical protein
MTNRNAVASFSPALTRSRLRRVNGQNESNAEGVVAAGQTAEYAKYTNGNSTQKRQGKPFPTLRLCVFALKICANERGVGGRAKESVAAAPAGRHICRIRVVNEFKLRQERHIFENWRMLPPRPVWGMWGGAGGCKVFASDGTTDRRARQRVENRGRDGAERLPSLQTGRADFPHPAFQLVSPRQSCLEQSLSCGIGSLYPG